MIAFQASQIYLVTGASSGIGAATALELNRLGATVIATARREEKLQEIKNQSLHPENFHIHSRDIAADLEEIPAWVTELKKTYGKFSGLVHCAGHGYLSPVSAFNLDECQKLFNVHYFASMFLGKGITDRRNNIGAGTSLVYISSYAAHTPLRNNSMYASAKSAMTTGVRGLCAEVINRGIRVNIISPGPVDTPLYDSLSNTIEGVIVSNYLQEEYPLGISTPNNIAQTIIFLLSDANPRIVYQDILCAGKFG